MATTMPLALTEHQEQAALLRIVEMHTTRYPELKLLYAIPNGGNRNIIVAKKLKAEGVKAGVPDLCLPVARGPYHGLYIEMKKAKKGKTSESQRQWIQALRGQGYCAGVCAGTAEAWDTIWDYIHQGEPDGQ